MARNKRLSLAVVGLLVFVSFLLIELFLSEKPGAWSDTGIVLYAIGSVIVIIYFIVAVKGNNK